MKKLISIFLLFILLVTLEGCFRENYDGWKNVNISDIGTFKIPEEWIFIQIGDTVYITDKPISEEGYKVYLAGIITRKNGDDSTEDDYISPYDYYDAEYIELVSSEVFSNSAMYGKDKYMVKGNLEIKKYILLLNKDMLGLISWEELTNEEIMIKIAKSFKREK